MRAGRLFNVIAAGAIATILTASMVLSVPTRALAQDDDATAVADAKTPPAAMAGTWTGPLVDTGKSGTGTLTLDLTQVKATVGGTFSATGGTTDATGSLKGKAVGNKVTILLDQTNQTHPCKVNLKGKVLTLDEYTGTFKSATPSKNCKARGTFDIFLQP
ncbi:MAG: hypothetical protein ACREQR_04880 [Candidatus Binataceae bacterium]